MSSHFTGMKARGYYDAHSSLQSESFDWASRRLIDAIPGMELPPEDTTAGMALLRGWRGRAHAGPSS